MMYFDDHPKPECEIHALLIEDDLHFARMVQAVARHIEGNPICVEVIDLISELGPRLARSESACDGDIVTPRVDVIMTDLGLSESWGFETFCRVHEIASHLPIIVLTANADRDLSKQLIAAGADDFLQKDDVTPHRIERAVRQAVERHEMQQELQGERRYSQALKEENDRLKGIIANGQFTKVL